MFAICIFDDCRPTDVGKIKIAKTHAKWPIARIGLYATVVQRTWGNLDLGFVKIGFFATDSSKWDLSKLDFSKMDFSKKDFSKNDFFKIGCFFKQKLENPRPEFCPARRQV